MYNIFGENTVLVTSGLNNVYNWYIYIYIYLEQVTVLLY